ncbi:hypothetical protein FGB62_34g115 [Gracilaria domingensis]|nr:hypothetical protein FGB62_34g115 [Gracilaria domingensis]
MTLLDGARAVASGSSARGCDARASRERRASDGRQRAVRRCKRLGMGTRCGTGTAARRAPRRPAHAKRCSRPRAARRTTASHAFSRPPTASVSAPRTSRPAFWRRETRAVLLLSHGVGRAVFARLAAGRAGAQFDSPAVPEEQSAAVGHDGQPAAASVSQGVGNALPVGVERGMPPAARAVAAASVSAASSVRGVPVQRGAQRALGAYWAHGDCAVRRVSSLRDQAQGVLRHRTGPPKGVHRRCTMHAGGHHRRAFAEKGDANVGVEGDAAGARDRLRRRDPRERAIDATGAKSGYGLQSGDYTPVYRSEVLGREQKRFEAITAGAVPVQRAWRARAAGLREDQHREAEEHGAAPAAAVVAERAGRRRQRHRGGAHRAHRVGGEFGAAAVPAAGDAVMSGRQPHGCAPFVDERFFSYFLSSLHDLCALQRAPFFSLVFSNLRLLCLRQKACLTSCRHTPAPR